MTIHDKHVTHLPESVAVGVEHGTPNEPGDKYSRGAHPSNLARKPGLGPKGPIAQRERGCGVLAGGSAGGLGGVLGGVKGRGGGRSVGLQYKHSEYKNGRGRMPRWPIQRHLGDTAVRSPL